jgi:hypothetical protein
MAPKTKPGTKKVKRLTNARAVVAGAVIAAVAAIAAALISTYGHQSTPNNLQSLGQTSGQPDSRSSSQSTARGSTQSSRRLTGQLYKEETDNHLGTDVFRDSMGDAVTSGPVSIPFGTQVLVKCWSPNRSSMGSINAFYLVETPPWAGDYAPANTFLNADTSGALDPKVPECSAA